MSNQRTNSVLVFVAVLVAAVIVIYAVVSRKPAVKPPAAGSESPNAQLNESDVNANEADKGDNEADNSNDVTRIDQTTDTTTGQVPGAAENEREPEAAEVPSTLIEAARVGDVTVMRAMIDSGMDVNSADREGRTPLMFAAGGGHLDAVFVLLNQGADASTRDDARRSARDYALARTDKSGQTIARILEDAAGSVPVLDPAEK